MRKSHFIILFSLLVFLSGIGSSVVRQTPESIFIMDKCDADSNRTVEVPEELDIKLNGSQVSKLNCSKLEQYDYPDYPGPNKDHDLVRFDLQQFIMILSIGFIVSLGLGYNKGKENSLRAYLFPSISSFLLIAAVTSLYQPETVDLSTANIIGFSLPLILGFAHGFKARGKGRKEALFIVTLYLIPVIVGVIGFITSIEFLAITTRLH